MDMVIYISVENSRDYTVTYAHLKMCSDCTACKNRSVFGFNRPYLHIRILLFKRFTYSCDSSTCTYARTKSIYFAGGLLKYLQCRIIFVCISIVLILKLLRHKYIRIILSHLQRCIKTFLYTFSNISVIVYQNDFCPVMLN